MKLKNEILDGVFKTILLINNQWLSIILIKSDYHQQVSCKEAKMTDLLGRLSDFYSSNKAHGPLVVFLLLVDLEGLSYKMRGRARVCIEYPQLF